MEMKRKATLCLLMAMAVGFFCTESRAREPVLHRVGGGRYNWKPKVNFTEWATHDHFYKGDWLYFGFDKTLHNVLEVNKTSYENCTETNFIKNITRGGRDVFQLLEAKSYYFICGKGFCSEGMKVVVNVEELPPELPRLHVSKAFPSSSTQSYILFPVLVMTTALALTYI